MGVARELGLSWRAKEFISACTMLIKKYGGGVPSDKDTLLKLSGVGHYTANAVRCFGFGISESISDTNTIRLAARLSGEVLDAANHRSARIQKMVAALSANCLPISADDNYALLDLAALICRPKQPLCQQCPLARSCMTVANLKTKRAE
jgi:A/G-specific adenine glycosylase